MIDHAAFSPFAPQESRLPRQSIGSVFWDGLEGYAAYATGAAASTAWPLANLALFLPVYIPQRCIAYSVGFGTGATAGGNWDIGIYDLAGNRLKSTGTQSRTASAWNSNDWADYTMEPGWYYVAMSADSTANYSGLAPAAGLCESLGVCEMQSAFVLPNPATLVRTTRAFIPSFSINLRSVAL